MSDLSSPPADLRWHEQSRWVRPTNAFVKFKKEEIERSIPQRFEQRVKCQPDRLAVKTGGYQLAYAVLDLAANRLTRAILTQRGEGRP